MHKPLRLGLGLSLGFGFALLASAGGCSLTENFNQCQVDSDCPATNAMGQKLMCTSDNYCSVGTPMSKLCLEDLPDQQSDQRHRDRRAHQHPGR